MLRVVYAAPVPATSTFAAMRTVTYSTNAFLSNKASKKKLRRSGEGTSEKMGAKKILGMVPLGVLAQYC